MDQRCEYTTDIIYCVFMLMISYADFDLIGLGMVNLSTDLFESTKSLLLLCTRNTVCEEGCATGVLS